jgi:hypothetical protein
MVKMAGSTILYDNQAITAALVSDTSVDSVEIDADTSEVIIHSNFDYGSSGTDFEAEVSTSLDGGTTWVEVYVHAGTTSDERKVVVLKSAAVAAYDGTTAVADDALKDGIIGTLWRCRVTTNGTYADTTLRVDIIAKR